jgi:SET domain-containing protein
MNHYRVSKDYDAKAHGPAKENARARVLRNVGRRPRILIVADRDIEPGEEVMYDYGERRPHVIAVLPWLKEASNPRHSRSKCQLLNYDNYFPP